jgi:hypothetical protein
VTAQQEGSEGTQSIRGRRTMPEDWVVPDRSPEYVPDDYTRPLNG